MERRAMITSKRAWERAWRIKKKRAKGL